MPFPEPLGERETVRVLTRKMYVLSEFCLFARVQRGAGLLSPSCGNSKDLIFPKLLGDQDRSTPRSEEWGRARVEGEGETQCTLVWVDLAQGRGRGRGQGKPGFLAVTWIHRFAESPWL